MQQLLNDSDSQIDIPTRGSISDGSLLGRLQDGEADAATRIYLRYARRLQILARSQSGKDLASRVDPEDIVQSVFRTFFRRVKDGHYQIPDGEELWKLLLVITLNKVRAIGAHHRAARRDVGRTLGGEQLERSEPSDRADDQSAVQMLKMVIGELLTRLTEVQRRMVVLRIDGHEIADIARLTQRSKRSVERTLQQFRTMLNRELHEGPDRAEGERQRDD